MHDPGVAPQALTGLHSADELAEIDLYLAIEDRLLARVHDLPVDVAADIHALVKLCHRRIRRRLDRGGGGARRSPPAADDSPPGQSLAVAA